MSDNSALEIVRLQVRRMPGISDPFTIDALQPGVNIIHGPNGSGKTSTARALEAVIWPTMEKDRKSVAARYTLAGSDYTVDLDAGHLAVQSDGKRDDVPQLPLPDFRERYRLSLHELLVAADTGDRFAVEIERQSSGGYDLAAAHDDLDFRARPSTATKELAELDSARRKLKEVQSVQAAVHEDARRLVELEKRCEESAPASARKEVLDAAIQHARARAEHAHATSRRAAFSPLHRSIHGTEQGALVDLTQRAGKAAAREKLEGARVAQADEDARAAFPDGAASDEVMTVLREEIRALEFAEQARTTAQRDVAAADAGLRDARRALGPAVTDEQLAGIDAGAMADLSTFARQAERQAAEITAVKAEIDRAESAIAPSDLDAVRSGMEVLSHWLAEGEPGTDAGFNREHRKAMIVAGIIAAVISVVLALWSLGAAIGALVAGVLVLLGIRPQKSAAPSARPQRQKDYARLGLGSPEAWTPEAVAPCLDSLCRRLGDGRLSEARVAWQMEARRRLQDLEARNQNIERQQSQLASRFGVAPDTDARQLAWLAERIGRWQDARQGYTRAAASLVTCERQLRELCERVCARVAPLGYQSISSASDAKGCAAALEARIQKYQSAIRDRTGALSRLDEARQEGADLAAQIGTLLRPNGTELIDAVQLEALCSEHAAYEDACTALALAEDGLQKTRGTLINHAYFTDDLLIAPESEMEMLRAEQERLLAGYVDLVKEAEALRTRVEQAKCGTDVECALADVAAAESVLEAMREKDLAAMVGDALIRHLQDVARNQHRPAVFRRAREIFSTITRGRYLLDFHDGGVDGSASFRAIDQMTRVGHPLNELSSASRVQLLLAVRIAFVEAQEQGVRLPLFLDETLGTSDDVRARAIIDAILTLAEGGRQVFYFTAQCDEVAKWRVAAKQRAAAVKVVDLAVIRSMAAMGDGEIAFMNLPDSIGPLVPAPEGKTRDEYAELLNVPPISDRSGGAAAAHLWYLVDDLNVLHELLSFGMTTWGQLSTMLANGGLGLAARHEQVIARAAALARVLDTLLQELAVGRGRPVDRAALLDSGAVSNLKIDEVAAVADHSRGNARAFIAAMENKAVVGFQTRKIADLRAYLEREGYLDEQAPRSEEEIRAAVLTTAASDIHAGLLRHADLDRLLSSLQRRWPDGVSVPLASAGTAGRPAVLSSQEVVLPA